MPYITRNVCRLHPDAVVLKDDDGDYCEVCGDDRHMGKVKVRAKKEQEFEECDAGDATLDKD